MNTTSSSEETLFLAALGMATPELQAEFLDRECAGNASLRARVEHLLARARKAGDFFGEDPAVAKEGTEILPMTEQPGKRIGRYKLLEKIGDGGMGVVYMAEQIEPVRRRVALKIIKPGMDTRQVVARFEAERQALAMMDHPNIARVLDGGATATGRPYFVMELVHGVPITEYCDRNRLSLRERLDLILPVCRAIQSAHHKGIIHRDIKPSNVMVTIEHGEPMPKVIDFGVARATNQRLTEKTVFTHYGTMIGTPAYMSPEQAEMTSVDVDTRTDVYSLGALLYELLTGTTPFPEKRLRSLGYGQIQKVIAGEEPEKPSNRMSTTPEADKSIIAHNRGRDASALGGDIRGDLDWIVMKCLEKDRRRRYETPNELAADLLRYMTNEPVVARPPSVAYRLQKSWRRNRLVYICSAAVVAALVGGLAVSTWQAVRATRAERLAGERLTEAVAERDAKEQASREARMVSHFLAGVFESPDPGRNARSITVAEILDAAVERLDSDLVGEPDRRMTFAIALGHAYYNLGLYRESVPLRESAYARLLATEGPEHHHTLAHAHYLGMSYYAAGRLEDAIRIQKETLAIRIKVNGPEGPDTLWSTGKLATSYAAAGRGAEAHEMREKLLPVCRKVLPKDHYFTLITMDKLGASRFEAGRREEALALMEESLALHRRALGDNNPLTLVSMGNLARHYHLAGRREDALHLRETALTRSRDINGSEHPATLTAMSGVAESWLGANRRDEALTLMEEVVTLRRKVSGPGHPDTRSALRRLAALCRENGNDARARALETETAEAEGAPEPK